MANMVIANEGKIKWLGWALVSDGSDFEDFVISLYQNNYVPEETDTAGNFTVATFTGYADVPADRANFSDPTIAANIATSVLSFFPTFTCTGGASQVVFGWYMLGATSGTLLAAQVFDAPRTMSPGISEILNPFQISLKTFA